MEKGLEIRLIDHLFYQFFFEKIALCFYSFNFCIRIRDLNALLPVIKRSIYWSVARDNSN